MARCVGRRDLEDWIEESRRVWRIARAVLLEAHRDPFWLRRVRAHAEALAILLEPSREPDAVISARSDKRYRTLTIELEPFESE
jgi:hypothetical protein